MTLTPSISTFACTQAAKQLEAIRLGREVRERLNGLTLVRNASVFEPLHEEK